MKVLHVDKSCKALEFDSFSGQRWLIEHAKINLFGTFFYHMIIFLWNIPLLDPWTDRVACKISNRQSYIFLQYAAAECVPVNVTSPTYSLISYNARTVINIIRMQIWSEIAPQLYYISAIKHKWHHDDSRPVFQVHTTVNLFDCKMNSYSKIKDWGVTMKMFIIVYGNQLFL